MSDLIPAVVRHGVILAPGVDQNGVPHFATKWIEYYPGDTIMLPADEVVRLQRTGALVSPPPATRRMIAS